MPPKIPVGLMGRGIFFWFKLGFFSLFLAYLLIHAIAIGIQERDALVVVKELGKEFYSPLQASQESINNLNSESLFGSLWGLWGLFFNVYKLYLWIKIILMFLINPFLKDAIPLVIRLFFALAIFYTIQVLFAVLILKESINLPFISTWNILKGMFNLITNPNFDFSVKNIYKNNSCSGEICSI